MFSSLVRPLARNVLARSGPSNFVRQAHEPAKSGSCLMDQLPVPEGSWEANFKAQNAKYNMQLVAGVAFFIATLAFCTPESDEVTYHHETAVTQHIYGELNGFFYCGAKLPELPKKQ